MAKCGDQTCQRFEATAVGFETGFSRLRVRPSNRYVVAPHLKYLSTKKLIDLLFGTLCKHCKECHFNYKMFINRHAIHSGWHFPNTLSPRVTFFA